MGESGRTMKGGGGNVPSAARKGLYKLHLGKLAFGGFPLSPSAGLNPWGIPALEILINKVIVNLTLH